MKTEIGIVNIWSLTDSTNTLSKRLNPLIVRIGTNRFPSIKPAVQKELIIWKMTRGF